MGRPVGICVVALLFASIMAIGLQGSGLEDPIELDVRAKSVHSDISLPVVVLPYSTSDRGEVYRYDLRMMYDMSIAVAWPAPYVKSSLGVPLPPMPGPERPYTGDPIRLDVLFCLDTTGSMCDEIAVAKATIIDIAAAVAAGDPKPDVRYALVIYRDLEDEYVTKVYDFMSAEDLADVLEGVEADEGGDYRESVSEALHKSVQKVSWDLDEASCAIYLIGDAPPHADYLNGYDHVLAAAEAAEKGIVINAIGCSGIQGNEMEFMEVVELTGGEFVYLNYTGGGRGGYYGKDTCDGASLCFSKDGSSSGSGDNDLDEVLTRMLRSMAEEEGVEYDD